MDKSIGNLLYGVGERIIDYLPSLLGGVVLLAVGWLLGWVVKRVVFHICVAFRLDRVLRAFRWGEGFSKADARYALFESIGNVAFFVVFLFLLNAALSTMQLTILSDLLRSGVLFIPKFVIALVIIGLGAAVSNRVALGIYRGLASEGVPKAKLIARLSKAVLVLFFAAMAMTELDIARQIVLIGFTTILVTICVWAVLLTGLTGRGLARRFLEGEDEDGKK